MDKTLLLAQMIKNEEFGHFASEDTDTVVIDYNEGFETIFGAWLLNEIDPNQYSAQITSTRTINIPTTETVDDLLFSELHSLYTAALASIDAGNEVDAATLAKHKIVCTCWNHNPGENVILENFRWNSERGETYFTCRISYMSTNYNYLGVIDGILKITPTISNSQISAFTLVLNTTYGVFNIHFEQPGR